ASSCRSCNNSGQQSSHSNRYGFVMKADLIVLNGRLITFADTAEGAGALAISGDRIAAVGEESDIRALAGPDTRVINAGGHTVLPGFIDSHVHLFQGSAELDALNLHEVRGHDALARVIQGYARSRPDDDFLFATAADYDMLATGQSVTRHDLDRIIDDRAFAMVAGDHHTIWANTAALEKAGILNGADVPEGSTIVMGDDGKATGLLI